jgi:hypothetical protein
MAFWVWTYWITKTFLITTVFLFGTAWIGIDIWRGLDQWLAPVGLPGNRERDRAMSRTDQK